MLCWFVISSLLIDKVIDLDDLKSWNNSEFEWKRRAVPIALVELNKIRRDLKPDYEAKYPVEDKVHDKDPDMDKTFKLINNKQVNN